MLTNIEVVKKDGRIQPFDITKLLDAVKAAASDIDYLTKEVQNLDTPYVEKLNEVRVYFKGLRDLTRNYR